MEKIRIQTYLDSSSIMITWLKYCESDSSQPPPYFVLAVMPSAPKSPNFRQNPRKSLQRKIRSLINEIMTIYKKTNGNPSKEARLENILEFILFVD